MSRVDRCDLSLRVTLIIHILDFELERFSLGYRRLIRCALDRGR
jgi:hypothetical protein